MIVPSEIRMNILSYVTMNNIKEIYKKYPICNKYIMNEMMKLDICPMIIIGLERSRRNELKKIQNNIGFCIYTLIPNITWFIVNQLEPNFASSYIRICFISHGDLYLKSENEPIITFVKQLCDLGIKATYEHQPSRIDVILIHENINNIYMDIVISDELSNYYIKDSDSDKDYHHSLTHLINK